MPARERQFAENKKTGYFMNNSISPQIMHKLMVMKACISGLTDFHKNQNRIFHNA